MGGEKGEGKDGTGKGVGGREVRPKGAIQIRYYYYYRGKEGGKGRGGEGEKEGDAPLTQIPGSAPGLSHIITTTVIYYR